MRNLILILFVLSFNLGFSQVAFGGKTSIDGDGVVDFSENLNKGIILPWVEDTAKVSHTAGTLLYNSTEKK